MPLLHGYSSELPLCLATCYELSWNLAEAWSALELQKSRAVKVQISNLNRLQRSFVADKVAAVQKDSTVGSAKFLVGVLQAIETYVRDQLETPTYSKVSVRSYCFVHTSLTLAGSQKFSPRLDSFLEENVSLSHSITVRGGSLSGPPGPYVHNSQRATAQC